MPDQYYQVAMNDSWRWAKVDFFVDHTHHPWSSLLYSTIVLYDIPVNDYYKHKYKENLKKISFTLR